MCVGVATETVTLYRHVSDMTDNDFIKAAEVSHLFFFCYIYMYMFTYIWFCYHREKCGPSGPVNCAFLLSGELMNKFLDQR